VSLYGPGFDLDWPIWGTSDVGTSTLCMGISESWNWRSL